MIKVFKVFAACADEQINLKHAIYLQPIQYPSKEGASADKTNKRKPRRLSI